MECRLSPVREGQARPRNPGALKGQELSQWMRSFLGDTGGLRAPAVSGVTGRSGDTGWSGAEAGLGVQAGLEAEAGLGVQARLEAKAGLGAQRVWGCRLCTVCARGQGCWGAQVDAGAGPSEGRGAPGLS